LSALGGWWFLRARRLLKGQEPFLGPRLGLEASASRERGLEGFEGKPTGHIFIIGEDPSGKYTKFRIGLGNKGRIPVEKRSLL